LQQVFVWTWPVFSLLVWIPRSGKLGFDLILLYLINHHDINGSWSQSCILELSTWMWIRAQSKALFASDWPLPCGPHLSEHQEAHGPSVVSIFLNSECPHSTSYMPGNDHIGLVCCCWFSFFCSIGIWTQGLTLFEPLCQPFFVLNIFEIRSCELSCPSWPQTVILLISASCVARITGVSTGARHVDHIWVHLVITITLWAGNLVFPISDWGPERHPSSSHY
jgi:hypothetical protein